MKKAYVRPIGDGDSVIFVYDKDGNEVWLDTPEFEEYAEADLWCYQNGYKPVYGE